MGPDINNSKKLIMYSIIQREDCLYILSHSKKKKSIHGIILIFSYF